jgi:hypothetical protein
MQRTERKFHPHRQQETIMIRRLVLAALLLIASLNVRALEYTDVYYDTAESGWGVFLVQSDTTQFLAFFIYGADEKATWYAAQLANDGTGNYTLGGCHWRNAGP